MQNIERAVLSCYDKTGLVELARVLEDLGVDLVCTGGTLKALKAAGVKARAIQDFTGVQEMLDGRLKSLHPKIHAGLLAIRENKVHTEQMQACGYPQIDLVVVNLHPIEEIVKIRGLSSEEVVDQLDVGGVSMIRSAAKNFRYVTVVVNPERYSTVIHELRAHEGRVTFPTRFRLAQEAFARIASYDRAIADYLRQAEPPEE